MYFDEPTNQEYLHTLEQFYWALILISCWFRDLMIHWDVKADIRLCLMLPLTNRKSVVGSRARGSVVVAVPGIAVTGWWRGGVSPPLAHPPLGVTQGETGMIKQMTPSHPCRRKHEQPTSHISWLDQHPADSPHSNISARSEDFYFSTKYFISVLK